MQLLAVTWGMKWDTNACRNKNFKEMCVYSSDDKSVFCSLRKPVGDTALASIRLSSLLSVPHKWG